MPEISRFFGIIIRMYYDDHSPPHFHSYYQNYEASYDINSGKKMGVLPPRTDRIVSTWARQYRKELLNNWELIKREGRFNKIPGANK